MFEGEIAHLQRRWNDGKGLPSFRDLKINGIWRAEPLRWSSGIRATPKPTRAFSTVHCRVHWQ